MKSAGPARRHSDSGSRRRAVLRLLGNLKSPGHIRTVYYDYKFRYHIHSEYCMLKCVWLSPGPRPARAWPGQASQPGALSLSHDSASAESESGLIRVPGPGRPPGPGPGGPLTVRCRPGAPAAARNTRPGGSVLAARRHYRWSRWPNRSLNHLFGSLGPVWVTNLFCGSRSTGTPPERSTRISMVSTTQRNFRILKINSRLIADESAITTWIITTIQIVSVPTWIPPRGPPPAAGHRRNLNQLSVYSVTGQPLISGVNQGNHQINWDNPGYPGLVSCGPERVGTGATPTGWTYRSDLRKVLGENQPP